MVRSQDARNVDANGAGTGPKTWPGAGAGTGPGIGAVVGMGTVVGIGTDAPVRSVLRPLRRRALAAACAIGGSLALAGCGFQLRRSARLPFRTLYTNFSPVSAIGAEFRRLIRVAEDTRIVDDPAEAEARLEVLMEQRERDVVAFSSTGRPREYQLRLRFRFRVVDAQQQEMLPVTELVLSRDITTSDIEVVAKQQEEELLYREMQSDLVQQLLRRLAAIGPDA